MNRYPHNRWAPAFACAAVFATVVTMAVAVVLPAKMPADNGNDATVLARTARAGEVTITLERVDDATARTAAAEAETTVIVPAPLLATKQPG